ncbi:hypothetical protein ABKA04_000959 [Annulohypoxylon sp. FPYF3050]
MRKNNPIRKPRLISNFQILKARDRHRQHHRYHRGRSQHREDHHQEDHHQEDRHQEDHHQEDRQEDRHQEDRHQEDHQEDHHQEDHQEDHHRRLGNHVRGPLLLLGLETHT